MESLEIIEIADLSLDETSFEISVDNTSGLWCQSTLHDGPCSDFLGSGSVEGLQAQGLTSGTDQTGNHRPNLRLWALQTSSHSFFLALLKKGLLVLWIILQVKIVLFELTRDWNDLTATVFLNPFANLGQPLATLADETLLRQVHHVNLWLGSDHSPVTNNVDLSGRVVSTSNGSIRFNQLFNLRVCLCECLRKLEIRGLSGQSLFLSHTLTFAVIHALQIGGILGTQLALDGFQIPNGIHRIIDMDHFITGKDTNQMINTINGSNVTQESITKTGSLTGTLDQTGNICYL
mmetsp:Transcript_10515/g.25392  ORF Transcript_10515/g.25392 Transcript_10515/m.25392 type:complete len:291 (-) Transcript_10515:338-1210(-)